MAEMPYGQRPSSSASSSGSSWSSRRASSSSSVPPVPSLPAYTHNTSSSSPILYQHPFAKIVKFELHKLQPTSPTQNDIPSITTSADTSLDYEVDAVGALPWHAPGETIIALGRMKIQHVAGSTPFIHSGSVAKPLMNNSQCWCVDGRSVFVLRIGKLVYYRIELPGDSPKDMERVEELKQVLSRLILYEVTPCPFQRSFSVSLPVERTVPKKKKPWRPKVDPAAPRQRALSLGGCTPDIYGPNSPVIPQDSPRSSRLFADSDVQRPKTSHEQSISTDFSALNEPKLQSCEEDTDDEHHESSFEDQSSPCTPSTPDVMTSSTHRWDTTKVYQAHSLDLIDESAEKLSPSFQRLRLADFESERPQHQTQGDARHESRLTPDTRRHGLVAQYTQNFMPNSSPSDTAAPLETRPAFLRTKTSPPVQQQQPQPQPQQQPQQQQQSPSSSNILHKTRPPRPRSQSFSHMPKNLLPQDDQKESGKQGSALGSFTTSLYKKALRPPMQAVVLLLQIGMRIATAEVDPGQLEKYSPHIERSSLEEDRDFGIPLALRQSEDTWRRSLSPGDKKTLSSVE